MDWSLLVLPGLIIWSIILLLPWRPWGTRESLDAGDITQQDFHQKDFSEITVLIPARNEAEVIKHTLSSLKDQAPDIKVILIDDQSDDDTASIAQQVGLSNLKIVKGENLPTGWSGKLWALEQGLKNADSEIILLLDADIALEPNTLNRLLHKMQNENLDLVSLMAFLRMESFWEKFLMPAFIYFFKLLYPFQLSNAPLESRLSKYVAAAAGGCILVRKKSLDAIGGFSALKNSLIDDCTLARKIKMNGGKTWIGLTHSAVSHRQYNTLTTIWEMVSRTAYTQLLHSLLLLAACSLIMIGIFIFPVIGLFTTSLLGKALSSVTLMIMFLTYLPVLKYYGRNPIWAITLPFIGTLYLLMTWSSAYRHIFGKGASWKQRQYTA